MSLFFGLIEVGSVLFFILLSFYFIVSMMFIEKENDNFIGITLIVGIILLLTSSGDIKSASTKESIINFAINVAGWLGIGLTYWFIMLNIDFYKIRTVCKKYSANSINQLTELYYDSANNRSRKDKDEIFYAANLYKNEPCFETFITRVIAWPLSLIKVGCSRFATTVFAFLVSRLKGYKARLTGIIPSEN